MSHEQANPSVILVSRDIFFFSGVQSTASQLGCQVQLQNELPDKIGDSTFCMLVIDLELPGLNFDRLADYTLNDNVYTLAYAPHVKTDLIEQARQAGVNSVVSRGQFSQSFKAILTDKLQEIDHG